MDLNTITEVTRPQVRDDLDVGRDGDACLAGGTWLLSEPQPGLRRLIDLTTLGWPSLHVSDAGLTIAATCTVAELNAFEPPPTWRAAPLFAACCSAFLASFKIWATATVGGNLCCALPAGPMISLTAALDGSCLIWMPKGDDRRVPVHEFIRGPQDTALAPGEVLRQIDLPRDALGRRTAFRRISLTPLGRSAALLIGTLAGDGGFALTVTASTRRPVRIAFDRLPEAATLTQRVEAAIPPPLYYDDVHGRPDWRRHMTLLFAEEIRAELAGHDR